MNILYVVHYNEKGGATLSFLEMISIIRNEHNVYVVTPHKKGFLPQQLDTMRIPHCNAHYFWWEIATPSNRILANIKILIYRILNIWNYVEACRLKRKIKKEKIELIHSNSSVVNFGALLSQKTGIPHVWHLREYGEEDFGLKRVVSENRFRREMNEFAVKYIAISQSIKRKFSNIVDENKICQIYNGVSEDYYFEKTFTKSSKKKIRFLIAGNYCIEKGQVDAVYAVIELKKQGIDGFELYLAGNGDFAEPKRLVKEYDLHEQVIFCGCIDNMLQLRKNTDVEIVASKHEAFGRVTIESMRMSNPVIGTNSGGTPELIKDGYNGFLFEYGDYTQLAEYMKKYIIDRTMIGKMGRNAYCSTKNMFTSKENARRILEIYDEINDNIWA